MSVRTGRYTGMNKRILLVRLRIVLILISDLISKLGPTDRLRG